MPRKLCTLWSDLLTDVALEWRKKLRWVKLGGHWKGIVWWRLFLFNQLGVKEDDSVFLYPRKNQLFPRIFSISYPRKIESTREKIFKTAREKKIVPVKNVAKLHPRKKIPHPRKKYKIPPEKIPKVPEKKSLKNMGKKTKQQYSWGPETLLVIFPIKILALEEWIWFYSVGILQI